MQTPGVTRDCNEYLEYIAKPRPFKDLALVDAKIRALGEVALIHGRARYTMIADGSVQEALYTDAYQKREGLGLRNRSGGLTCCGAARRTTWRR
ncbi:hypothetical protein ABIE00_002449 [Arthrobacter sp. OAP107]